MGVVNVTPDSFSDGGRFSSAADAIAHGRRLASEGAALVDSRLRGTRSSTSRLGRTLVSPYLSSTNALRGGRYSSGAASRPAS